MTAGITPQSIVATTGTYVGDNSANKAITHSLGRIPYVVLIFITNDTPLWMVSNGYVLQATVSSRAVTTATSTYFYVGNAGSYPQSANELGKTYRWMAL